MKKLIIVWVALISILMTACYDDYEKDYEKEWFTLLRRNLCVRW